MASVDPRTKTTYATTNWDYYRQGRPSYPPSLTDIICNYHRRHPKAGWERLVDIGAGSGVASTNFMPHFRVIHISDPSPSNLDQARSFLPDWAQQHGLKTSFEYTQSTGEEAYTETGEGQADMVICATAAHFIDPDGLAASIAKMLRPGDTMAVFSYWMPSFPGKSHHLHHLFEQAFDKMVLKTLQSKEEGNHLGQTRLCKVVERRMTGKGVLDSLPVPEGLFDDPVRVYINSGTGEIPFSGVFRKFFPGTAQLGGVSRLSARDQVVRYDTGTDPEAEGWEFDVDKKWLSTLFDTIRPPGTEMSEEAQEGYACWEQAFDDECPDGTVRVKWPAYLVLASRE